MTASLFISQGVLDEFGERIEAILAGAPRRLALLPFVPGQRYTDGEIAGIEVAYYSRNVWEGTERSRLSPAAAAFWEIVEPLPGLRWLAVFSAGTDQPQYQRALERGVRVSTGAGAQSEAVGSAGAIGVLALARGLDRWWTAQARSEWRPLRGTQVPADLAGQTAVIVGAGRIGTVIARMLRAAGMRTVGIRRHVAPCEHYDRVLPPEDLDGLLPGCDWLVLACPLTAATRGLIDRRRLALLPPHAGIANIARGELVDEAALVEALAAGRLRHAYLDVFEHEPLPPSSPLWTLPGVLVSPHNAGASTGTYARGVDIFLRNLAHYLHGRPLENEAARE